MSNPIKSFMLSGNLQEGSAENTINPNYANIYSGVWQLSLLDFHVICSQSLTDNILLKVSTNQVTGTTFNSKGQPCTEEVTFRSFGLASRNKQYSFNLTPLWFMVNLPSNSLKVNVKVINGKLSDLKAQFVCTMVLQRVC